MFNLTTPLVDTEQWAHLKRYIPRRTSNNPLITLTSAVNTSTDLIEVTVNEVDFTTDNLYLIACVQNDNNLATLPILLFRSRTATVKLNSSGFVVLFAKPVVPGEAVKTLYTLEEYENLTDASNLLVIKSDSFQPNYNPPPTQPDSLVNNIKPVERASVTTTKSKTEEAIGSIQSSISSLVRTLQTFTDVIKEEFDTNSSAVSGTKPFLDEQIELYKSSIERLGSNIRDIMLSTREQLSNAIVNRTNNHVEVDSRSESHIASTYIQQRAPLIEQSSQSNVTVTDSYSLVADVAKYDYKTIITQASSSLLFGSEHSEYINVRKYTYADEFLQESARHNIITDGLYILGHNKGRRPGPYTSLENSVVIEAFSAISSKAAIVQMYDPMGGKVICQGGNVFINCGALYSYEQPQFEVTYTQDIYQYKESGLPKTVDAPTDTKHTPQIREESL